MGITALILTFRGPGLTEHQGKDVTFDDYMKKIDHFFEMNDLKNINLVGHSMAGMLLPNIALDESQGVINLIFLTAYVLNKAKALWDLCQLRMQRYFMKVLKSPTTIHFFRAMKFRQRVFE